MIRSGIPRGIPLFPHDTEKYDKILPLPEVFKMVDIKEMDKKIRSYCEENKIFGVVRVTIAGEIAYDGKIGYADLETKREFDERSMFTYYSLSKPFCVLGFLKLVDKGLVDVDSHPGKYLSEAEKFDPRVTLRQMLCHVSGLPDFEENSAFFNDDAVRTTPESRLPASDTRRILNDMKRLHELPLHFDPGTGGWYANINIMTPALIIERLTGEKYEDYMKKEVFGPLGMKNTVVDAPGLSVPDRVTGYELDENQEFVPVSPKYDWLLGAGDLLGTVDDVYCLNKAIKNRLLLKPETWDMALTPDVHSSMGMGCTITEWHGKHRITHNGGHKGFRTFHIQLPEDDFDIIILSNSGFGNARNDISEIVHSAFYGEGDDAQTLPEWDKGFAK
jgi:CubicO group peptidase (beta-lactamase class C family)